MLAVTPPIAVDTDAIWVLVSSRTGAVDAARMAHNPDTGTFVALPCEAFDTTALLPACQAHGEPLDGFRWASVVDIETHTHLFTGTERDRS